MKKFLLLFVVAAFCWSCDGPIVGSGSLQLVCDFEVDGIYYNHLEGTDVEVTYPYLYSTTEGYEGAVSDYEGNVIIPSTVTYNDTTYQVIRIGESTFRACYELKSVSIPEGVTEIGRGAFGYCTGLTSVSIPNSVTTIQECAFFDCTILASITFPARVAEIGQDAFNYCSGLEFIKSLNPIPPTIYDGTFLHVYIPDDIPVYVPAESIEAYKNAAHWKRFTNIQATE